MSLGVILLGSLAVEKAADRLNIPAITSYILFGIVIGPHTTGLAGSEVAGASELMSHIVLGLIAFQIGSNFRVDHFGKIGREVLGISLAETASAWLFVTLGVFFLAGTPLHIALVYGAIAAATAPAATMMVIRQYGAKGRFTDVLLGIVAIDDAWGILVFSFSIFIAASVHGGSGLDGGAAAVFAGVGGDILVSVLLGAAMAFLVKHIGGMVRRRGDTLVFVLGGLMATTGLAIFYDISPLLTNIIFGAVLVNIERTAFRYFDFLKTIDWPLYIIFYVVVGMNLEVGLLGSIGMVSAVYFVMRIIGKAAGAWAGGTAVGAPATVRNYMGLALMPQAGVALGLALVARSTFPEVGTAIFTAITASTVVYEVTGPLATRFALSRAGEIRERKKGAERA